MGHAYALTGPSRAGRWVAFAIERSVLIDFDEGSTLETQNAVTRFARMKTLKYVLRHPFKGTRNLLALRGARSLVTKKGAAVTAAVATAAAVPFAVLRARGKKKAADDA